jgi:hypothetical protein
MATPPLRLPFCCSGDRKDIYGPRLSCSIAAALLLAGYGGMAVCLAFGKGTSPVLFGPLLSLAGKGLSGCRQ